MKERLRTFRFDEVIIKNGLFHNRIDINKSYLKELDDTALLQNYYFEAGIIIPGMGSCGYFCTMCLPAWNITSAPPEKPI